MNFFHKKTTWSTLEFIPLKLCIGTAYLLIGGWFPELVKRYQTIIWIIFIPTVLWSLYQWFHKMKVENP